MSDGSICGVYFRQHFGFDAERSTYIVRVVCADCARESSALPIGAVVVADSMTVHRGRMELMAQQCPSPRLVPPSARLLRFVGLRALKREPFTLQHALRFGVGAGGLAPLLDRAWTECPTGSDMAYLCPEIHAVTPSDDGSRTLVQLRYRGARVSLDGPEPWVADALRWQFPRMDWTPVLRAIGLGEKGAA